MRGPGSKSPHRLLVEGPDGQHSVLHLLRRHGLNWEDMSQTLPYVESTGGISELLEALPVASKTYDRLGAVLDADLDLHATWEKLASRLRKIGLAPPGQPDSSGTIMDGYRAGSKLGLWVMPDNQGAGTLEHFLQRLVPAGNAWWEHSVQATERAIGLGAPLKLGDRRKGELHAWLAWQETPGMPFGTAITAHVLGSSSPEALAFVAWFKSLFGG
ncbi:MAG: hypothetical protein HYZ53_08280 [Planctomycetes bacterium]|nr:hypothetical protein [Planctomycetota bacterium]